MPASTLFHPKAYSWPPLLKLSIVSNTSCFPFGAVPACISQIVLQGRKLHKAGLWFLTAHSWTFTAFMGFFPSYFQKLYFLKLKQAYFLWLWCNAMFLTVDIQSVSQNLWMSSYESVHFEITVHFKFKLQVSTSLKRNISFLSNVYVCLLQFLTKLPVVAWEEEINE